ncbi:MAG: hypothetical protein RL030_2556 [Pseudomonadota bacterium]|jgi:hypothetical protein
MKERTKRNRRLLLALLLFAATAVSTLVQVWVTNFYLYSANAQDWTLFLEWFPSYALPPIPPGHGCFDDCSPDLPFVAGWIAVAAFVMGFIILARIWWVSKPRALPR